MKKKKKLTKYLALGVGAALLVFSFAFAKIKNNEESIEMISYTEYVKLLEQGEVDTVFYSETEDYMTVALFSDATRSMTEKERHEYEYNDNTYLRKVLYPENEDFKVELLEQGVIVKELGTGVSDWFERWGSLAAYLAIIAVMLYVVVKNNPANEKGFAAAVAPTDIDTTFDDVIGHDEIKEDLQLLVKQLRDGASIKDLSHGVLFEGGAGTGKTMLAKAIAHEAGVNFISVNSSNLVEMYVGLGARRVRQAFKKAREAAPCILFFDEIDAVGAERGNQRSHRENDQTINALLTELDGFQSKENILVIAATNRADNLDKALLRSGRFDRKVKIEAPKKWETRQELFEHYLKNKADTSVDTAQLAKEVVGFSGADIANVCREARLIAFRDDNEKITQENLQEAIDKIVFKGNRSNSEQHAQDLEVVAYHEAGHAVMSLLRGEEISRVSIHGMTSGVGGAVFHTDNERFFTTKRDVETRIMTAYAGRASEEIHFGDGNITEGASNDITQATTLLLSYVTKCGFDGVSGMVDLTLLTGEFQTSDIVTGRVTELSKELYRDTISLLKKKYHLVEKLAKKLLEVKTMSGDEVTELLNYSPDTKFDCPETTMDVI